MSTGAALLIFELAEVATIGFMPLQAVEGVVALVLLGLAAQRWLAALRPLRHALR